MRRELSIPYSTSRVPISRTNVYNGRMTIGRYFWMAVALAAFAVAAPAENPPLKFGQTASLDSIKILLPVLQGARENPPKPLEVFRYTFTRGDQSWIEDRCDALELWAERQFVGCWVDPRGNVMTLARLRKNLPAALNGQRVTREAFDRAVADPVCDVLPESPDEVVTAWMAIYCRSRATGPAQTVRTNTSRLAETLQIPLEDPLVRAFAFRLNPQYPGQAKAETGWFALVLNLADRPDSDTDRAIRDGLIGGIKSTGLFDGTRATSVRKNRSRAPAATVHETPGRERARASIAFLDNWWYMDSPNYIMLSDNQAAEQFAAKLLDELERLRPSFMKAVPPFGDAEKEVGIVRLFEKPEDYVAYLQGDFTGMDPNMTGGIFSGSRRELVIRPTSSAASNREGSVRDILKHEGFHQYIFLALAGRTPAVWLNEGFAGFFENCDVGSGSSGVVVGESKRHAAMLEQIVKDRDVDLAPAMAAFLALDYPAFYAAPDRNYALAWGVVYYLMRGAPMERNQPYANVLGAYLAELERGGDPAAATTAAFAGVDMRKFCDDFESFWRTTKKRQDALRKPWR